jgi:hypothetical protein
MKDMKRRDFLKLAGVGSVVAAGAAGPLATLLAAPRTEGAVAFRAMAGLPARPLPAFATYLVEGHVDLASRSGTVTKALFTGLPGARHAFALPGTTRSVRVTDVHNVTGVLHIRGVVDSRAPLHKGERRNVEIRLDRARGIAATDFMGSPVTLHLDS